MLTTVRCMSSEDGLSRNAWEYSRNTLEEQTKARVSRIGDPPFTPLTGKLRRTIMNFRVEGNRRGRRTDAGNGRASGQGRGPNQGADAGGSGTAGRGVRPPVLRMGRRGRPGGPFPDRRIRGSTLPLEFRGTARAWGVEDPSLQPSLRGTRLAVDPYRSRDGERRHALPGRLDEDGDKPPGLRHTYDPPPRHERAPRRGRPPPRGPTSRRRRGRRHLRVGDPRRGGPPDRGADARGLEAIHPEDPRRREGGRGGLATDAREDRGHSLRVRREPARLRA